MIRVDIKPELFRWARERAGMDIDTLVQKFSKYREWEEGKAKPTLKQLEKLANTTHAPVGFYFLSKPPDEPFPIPDFRTLSGKPVGRPSTNLLDTLYLCLRRQNWYREFMLMEGEEPLSFVGTASPASNIEQIAADMRFALGLDLEQRHALTTWTEALRHLTDSVEEVGVLVMVSGVVGNNAHRRLNPEEFRGFALSDAYAPLIFINAADTKAAQMFTLAHELAHIWLGRSALSDSVLDLQPDHDVETWCNHVAAEFLVPLAALQEEFRSGEKLSEELNRLARRFKVGTLVILRRVHDSGNLTRIQFRDAYASELKKLRANQRSAGGGGNFYKTQTNRVSKRFAHAIVVSTLEGKTLYRDAFRLLCISKLDTFQRFATQLLEN